MSFAGSHILELAFPINGTLFTNVCILVHIIVDATQAVNERDMRLCAKIGVINEQG